MIQNQWKVKKQEDFEDLEEEDFPTSGFEFGMNLAFKYLHENEEDFKRVRRLQQYLHRQYKDCSRKRYMHYPGSTCLRY